MTAKVLSFILLFSAFTCYAQNTALEILAKDQTADELSKHLSSAETYQISGDIINASAENKAIIGIALQRIGNLSIEEQNYTAAVKYLTESINYFDNAENRTNLAVAYLRLNQTDKALEEAKLAVAIDPKYPTAHYISGNIYFTKGDYRSALPELEKVLILAPDFDSARALGLTYLYLKQPERAKLLFEEIQASQKTESPDLHISFGQAYEQTNYPLESEREFKRALALNPKQPRASFFLGYVILQYGGSDRLSEAATAFEKELQLSPNDFYANFFAGVVASSENKHAKAVQYLNKAAQISPKRGEVYLFLGQSQIELNDNVAAEKNLRKAVELEGKDEKAKSQGRRTHFLLGRLLLKTNRKDEGEKELAISRKFQQESLDSARSEINQILGQVVENTSAVNNDKSENLNSQSNLSPETKKIKLYLSEILAQAYNNLGVIATQNNLLDEAVAKFSAALEWKPDFPNLNRNLGIITFRGGQYDKAIAPLSRQLQLNQKDTLIRQMLGASYYFTNNFAKAIETLKPIETALTSDAELSYFYGISLIRQKRNTEAIPIFNKLANISQKTPESLFYAAQGFMILGDYERAAKEFRTVILLAPETSKANYFIGQALIRLNRYAEAEKFFSRELEINPSDALSKYHLALTLIERKIETEKAVGLLEDAVNLRYGYADALYQLGKIYLEKGETGKAVEQLESAVNADSNKDYIHYQLSIAYRKMSRKEDADRELKLYQKLKADSRKTDSPPASNANSPK
jgi:tetratricopeptide (TPR) repeat protein